MFAGLERVLEETAGRFCVGDDVSVADVALVPQVYNAERYRQLITSLSAHTHTHTHTRLTALFPGLPG